MFFFIGGEIARRERVPRSVPSSVFYSKIGKGAFAAEASCAPGVASLAYPDMFRAAPIVSATDFRL